MAERRPKKKDPTKKFFELLASFFSFPRRDPPDFGTSRATFSREFFLLRFHFTASPLNYSYNSQHRNLIFLSQWLLFPVPFMASRSRLERC